MAMVDVDGSSHLLADSQPKSVGVGGQPGELSQWPWSWGQHHKHWRWLLLLTDSGSMWQLTTRWNSEYVSGALRQNRVERTEKIKSKHGLSMTNHVTARRHKNNSSRGRDFQRKYRWHPEKPRLTDLDEFLEPDVRSFHLRLINCQSTPNITETTPWLKKCLADILSRNLSKPCQSW